MFEPDRRGGEQQLAVTAQPLTELFFGADPSRLAPAQVAANTARLAEYEAIRNSMPDDVPSGPRPPALCL